MSLLEYQLHINIQNSLLASNNVLQGRIFLEFLEKLEIIKPDSAQTEPGFLSTTHLLTTSSTTPLENSWISAQAAIAT
jgi:hypothetical protein